MTKDALFRGWPAHPLIFALYNVLFLWGINAAISAWREALFLCVVALAVAAVIQLLCTAALHERLAGAVLASLVIMITFTYGRLYGIVVDAEVGGVRVGRHRFLLLVCAVLVVATGWALRRSKRSLVNATGALTIAAGLLVVLAAAPLARYAIVQAAAPAIDRADVVSTAATLSARPDIYYIIADGYGAASTLEGLYGFSNEPFLNALRDRGFYVAERSHANYVTTVLSLTSSLSMDYISAHRSHFAPAAPVAPDRDGQFQSMTAVRFARRLGYTVLNVNPLSRVDGATKGRLGGFIPALAWNSLSLEFIRSSILTELPTLLLPAGVRERFMGTVRALLATRSRPGPKFVFVHFMLPHPPFVFTASGAPKVTASERWTDRAAYIDQLRFVSASLLVIIDSLLVAPAGNPVIVLQGDHGPASEGEGSWRTPSPALIRERVPILNAYRASGRKCPFYQAVTPVNSFRIIFNCVFDARLPLLPDSSFFSPYDSQYEFRNVTAQVNDGDSLSEGKRSGPGPPLSRH